MKRKASIYQCIIFIPYIVSLLITYKIYHKIVTPDLLSIINLIAIFVTLGSALIAVGSILTSDFEKRIFLDIDILSKNILKINPDDEQWIRWPFLKRHSSFKLINGDYIKFYLNNPTIPLNLGFHKINIPLPTVYEDFFDLSFGKILYKIIARKNQFYIWYIKHKHENPDEMMKYECILDILILIFKIRFMKLIIHFGISLILLSLIFLFKL